MTYQNDTSARRSISLCVTGMGHVPAFKNGKLLCRGRLITHPEKQKWMEATARSIESQLRSLYRTTETETGTGLSLHSWTLTCLPLDDSLKWIGLPCGDWRKVKKGEEGAIIEITPLDQGPT